MSQSPEMPTQTLLEIRHFIDSSIASENRNINFEDISARIEGFEHEAKEQQLEALILLGYFLKKDAKKTFKLLGEYRAICVESGKQAYFDSFMARCEEMVYPRSLTVHGYSRTINTDNSELLTKGILAVVEAMDKIGYKIFINSGTLLGIVRENGYIPHDDDVDFGLLLHASDPVSAAHEWIELQKTMQEKGLLKHIGWMGGIFKTSNIGVFSVDLFPAWIEGDSVYVYPHTFGELKREDVLPLRKSESFDLPIPNCPEKMLEINYGPNWKIPDPLFRFHWGKARKKFDTFLTITEILDPRKAKA